MKNQIDIYIHTSQTSGKSYTGISTLGLKQRFTHHKAEARRGSNTHFHRALRKYSPEDFTSQLIDTVDTYEEAFLLEKFYIKLFNTFHEGYNMTEGGEGTVGYIPSQETIEKRRQANIIGFNEEQRLILSDNWTKNNPMAGSKRFKELNPFYNEKHTPESIVKMKGPRPHLRGPRPHLRNQGKSKPIVIDDKIYPSMAEASRVLDIPTATIQSRIKNTNKPNYTKLISTEGDFPLGQ